MIVCTNIGVIDKWKTNIESSNFYVQNNETQIWTKAYVKFFIVRDILGLKMDNMDKLYVPWGHSSATKASMLTVTIIDNLARSSFFFVSVWQLASYKKNLHMYLCNDIYFLVDRNFRGLLQRLWLL